MIRNLVKKWIWVLVLFCGLVLSGIQSEAASQSMGYVTCTVKKGDTLQTISRRYRVTWKSVAKLNALKYPYRLDQGQVIKIPKIRYRITHPSQTVKTQNAKDENDEIVPVIFLPSASQVEKVRDMLTIQVPQLLHWRYIVIHHSATSLGNASSFDKFHKRRRMEHGLAYHFVIDNGNGAPNGLIEVGKRWKQQWAGGHTANRTMNEIGIGICMVGNFEKCEPTRQQIESLVILCKELQQVCGIPDHNVILHRHVSQRGTLCPGKKFPWEKMRKMLLGTQFPESQRDDQKKNGG